MNMKAVADPVKFSLNTINNNNNNNNKLKKKKKKKKKRNKRIKKNRGIIISDLPINITSSSSSNSGIVLDEDTVVYEILTRLPVKSLIRFKSVCKRWHSLIQQDQNFTDLHRSKSRNPSLFIIVRPPPPRKKDPLTIRGRQRGPVCVIAKPGGPYKEFFLTADLIEGGRGRGGGRGASIQTVRKTTTFRIDRISNPINGLICFIDSEFHHAVQIYNISTQEESPWIKSTLLMKEKEELNKKHGRMARLYQGSSNYQFGFDPATNEHKLVCVRHLYRNDIFFNYNVCEVLTVVGAGDDSKINTWRRINEVPPYPVEDPSVYVNGSIYWSSYDLTGGNWGDDDYVFIVAFDVGSEKFRAIPVPNFILDQPREKYYAVAVDDDDDADDADPHKPDPYIDLLAVDGCVALLARMSGYIVKMWIFDDDNKENISTNSTTSNQNWTQVTITLPFCWGEDRGLYFHAVNDQIILRTTYIEQVDEEDLLNESELKKKNKEKKKSVSLYSYNWKKNILEEFEITGIPISILNLCDISLFTSFVGSLLPVPNLSNIAYSNQKRDELTFLQELFQRRRN